MKRVLLAALALFPALAFAAGGDIFINQRNAPDTATVTRLVVKPATTGIFGYDTGTQLPVYFTLGSNLTMVGGVLNAPLTTGPAGPKGDTGVTGPAGSNGSNGVSPVLSLGTVATGTSSSATLTGSSSAPVLNLVLQKGDTGSTGAAGANGVSPLLGIGTVSSGAAAATITGTATNPVLNLTLPSGATGATGTTGATGPAGAAAPTPVGGVVSRSLNTAFQPNATRPVLVSYSIDISVTSLVLAGTQGTATLQYADNSAMTTNLVAVDEGTSATGGVLNVTDTGTVKLEAMIPAGKYVRIVTANTSGTPVFAYRRGNETVF